MMMAKAVPNKGAHEYAVEVVRRFVEQVGYNKAILKSDNEPAILALKEAVRRVTSVEIVMEEVFVGDHQANGIAENSVKNARVNSGCGRLSWRAGSTGEPKAIIKQHRGWSHMRPQ